MLAAHYAPSVRKAPFCKSKSGCKGPMPSLAATASHPEACTLQLLALFALEISQALVCCSTGVLQKQGGAGSDPDSVAEDVPVQNMPCCRFQVRSSASNFVLCADILMQD
jgi:hypothetical protein